MSPSPPHPHPHPQAPPLLNCALISFPAPHILLVTLNRPRSLNSLDVASHWELHGLWEWFDGDGARECADLRVAVVTGSGRRAFCAGADLKEWERHVTNTDAKKITDGAFGRVVGGSPSLNLPPTGFAGLSRRWGKKPILGAINGIAYGGGMEMCVGLDLVLASRRSAAFALPEVKRGVVALAGALPRLARTLGRQRAMEMALTGRTVGVDEALAWGLVNVVVEDVDEDLHQEAGGDVDSVGSVGRGGGDDSDDGARYSVVVRKALEYATAIATNSPDAVIVSRQAVLMGWQGEQGDIHRDDNRGGGGGDGSKGRSSSSTSSSNSSVGVEQATRLHNDVWGPKLSAGDNMAEGLDAFVQKRSPRWVASRL